MADGVRYYSATKATVTISDGDGLELTFECDMGDVKFSEPERVESEPLVLSSSGSITMTDVIYGSALGFDWPTPKRPPNRAQRRGQNAQDWQREAWEH